MCDVSCLQFAREYLTEKEIKGKKVLEVGSRNVNGSVREIVESLGPQSYLGVDIVNDSGVDEICDISNLVEHFGKESFDVVISTELIEHVRDWRSALSNLKNVLKPTGTLLLTTRSKGFGYHGYPLDFWRYEIDDMKKLFSDMSIDVVESDPLSPGVFLKARKSIRFAEMNLVEHKLYSIVTKKRCQDVSDFDILLFRTVKRPSRNLASRILPAKTKARIKKMIRD